MNASFFLSNDHILDPVIKAIFVFLVILAVPVLLILTPIVIFARLYLYLDKHFIKKIYLKNQCVTDSYTPPSEWELARNISIINRRQDVQIRRSKLRALGLNDSPNSAGRIGDTHLNQSLQ